MKHEEAYQQLERTNFWIANCDTKSSIVLAFVGVFTPLIFTSSPMLDSLKHAVKKIQSSDVTYFSGIIFSFAGIAVAATLFFITLTILSILPSLTASVEKQITTSAGVVSNSDLFFHTIKHRSFADYYFSVSHKPEQDMFRDIHSQIYINSHICDKKFAHYNQSIKFLKYGLLSFLVLAIIYVVSL